MKNNCTSRPAGSKGREGEYWGNMQCCNIIQTRFLVIDACQQRLFNGESVVARTLYLDLNRIMDVVDTILIFLRVTVFKSSYRLQD